MFGFAVLIGLLTGCTQEPLFNGIKAVTVQKISASGLQKAELTQTGLQKARQCLNQTTEVPQTATESRMLMQNTYMLIIIDNTGARNFEMLTDQHLKGNKQRYYENTCIAEIVQQYGP